MASDEELAREAAQRLVETIAQRYPWLDIVADDTQTDVIGWIMPVQPGLGTEVQLWFSSPDEIHVHAGHFWIEYFPCMDVEQGSRFVDAVAGFIEGRYRIVEHYRGDRCVRADLEKPEGDRWKAIASWSRLHWPFPIKKTFKTIINRSAAPL